MLLGNLMLGETVTVILIVGLCFVISGILVANVAVGNRGEIGLRHKPTMPITIYGIKNCDTMKKARAWLDKHGVDYAFHDYKTAGIERAKLEAWAKKAGWETLLNRAGTTFRKLPDKDKEGLTEKKAHRADAGAALDDQAPGAGTRRRQAAGRLSSRRSMRRQSASTL